MCIAEKPSVAKAVAEFMSGGRKRERFSFDGKAPMCKLHDFYTYFPPAKKKCSVTVTSVIGHMYRHLTPHLIPHLTPHLTSRSGHLKFGFR